jgi:hypothetical protein
MRWKSPFVRRPGASALRVRGRVTGRTTSVQHCVCVQCAVTALELSGMFGSCPRRYGVRSGRVCSPIAKVSPHGCMVAKAQVGDVEAHMAGSAAVASL